jgi:DNA polymerase
MQTVRVRTFDEWREAARPLLASGVRWDEIEWRVHAGPPPPAAHADGLSGRSASERLAATPASQTNSGAPDAVVRLPRSLLELLSCLADYRHDGRWHLMYRLAWRVLHENRSLLDDEADADVRAALGWERAIHHDVHKMHAFVRFREIQNEDGSTSYFAWFEPRHEILHRAVPFFTKRFPNMNWTIATPDGAAVWERGALSFVAAPDGAALPISDSHDALWRTYYRSICNVARINPTTMQREMPQRYWRNLPEATEIPVLIRDGLEHFSQRHSEVDDTELRTAKAVQRAIEQLPRAEEGPAACRRCDLWRHATQAVEGAGPSHARIMLVGEQPGDEEDLRGHAFIGPAGKVLDETLASAGLDRGDIFVTNAVKHFRWEPRGKRRLHRRPDVTHIRACNVWLQREIATVQPQVIVALGGTALRALTGAAESIDSARSQSLRHETGAHLVATYHPSAVLRAEPARASSLRTHLIEDLRRARTLIS